jgi:TolA-binding protein
MQERTEHPVAPTITPTLALAPTPSLTPTPTPTPALTLTSTNTIPSTSAIPSTSTRVVAPPQASLADEVAAIKRARAALLSKDATTAIAALDDYDRAHPNGTMTEEALALRVRADRLAGDEVGAAEALTKLETRFPQSIHRAALR